MRRKKVKDAIDRIDGSIAIEAAYREVVNDTVL